MDSNYKHCKDTEYISTYVHYHNVIDSLNYTLYSMLCKCEHCYITLSVCLSELNERHREQRSFKLYLLKMLTSVYHIFSITTLY